MESDKKNNLIKKLLYQSKNRGYKETCLIVTKFADKYLVTLNLQELEDFSIILNQNDSDLYLWITQGSSYPKYLSSKLMKLLINYNNV